MKTQDEINELYRRLNDFKSPPVILTMDEVFGQFPEGDFHWKEDDPGDATPWYCDDCHKYHKAYYNWEFERKNGKRSLARYDGDDDGNWDIDESWEEGEDPTEILSTMANETDEYFKGWAEYSLYCAETGKDGFTGKHTSRQVAIKSARENINYLYMAQETHKNA